MRLHSALRAHRDQCTDARSAPVGDAVGDHKPKPRIEACTHAIESVLANRAPHITDGTTLRFPSGAACAAILLASVDASAQSAIETFDDVPAQTIAPGHPLFLEHFHVEMASDAPAVIRTVTEDDTVASGMALGSPAGPSGTFFSLYFKKAWRRVDMTLVLPPSQRNFQTVAMLYGNAASPYTLTVWDSPAGQRVRVSLSLPNGTSFDELVMRLHEGAYIDNVELR
ncbi:MAG: hypothetical protein ABWX83_09540 [Luteibacter sp.]